MKSLTFATLASSGGAAAAQWWGGAPDCAVSFHTLPLPSTSSLQEPHPPSPPQTALLLLL